MPDVIQLQRDYLQVPSKDDLRNGTGYIPAGRRVYSTVLIGSVAYASSGTSTATVAGTLYIAEVAIPRRLSITGIGALNGATVGTDKLVYALYDYQGNLVANTDLAGVISAGANAMQEIALTAVATVAPGRYFIATQGNGTTATIRLLAANTFLDCMTGSQAGTFGTLPALTTVPVTFTATVGPIGYVYGSATVPA